MKTCTAFALLLALFLTTSCHKKTAFELAHDKAVTENPYGVKMTIATTDGRVKFRLPEPIQLEEFYTAEYPGSGTLKFSMAGMAQVFPRNSMLTMAALLL